MYVTSTNIITVILAVMSVRARYLYADSSSCYSFPFFSFLNLTEVRSSFTIMSVEREVDDIVDEMQGHHVDEESSDTMALAAQEVSNLLSATGDSFGAICAEIEAAVSSEACRAAFRRFNSVLRIFLLTAGGSNGTGLHEAIHSMGPSDRFRAIMEEFPDIKVAISAYKEMILKELAVAIRDRSSANVVSEQSDEQLFARLLQSPPAEENTSQIKKRGATEVIAGDEVVAVPTKRLKSLIPALRALGNPAEDNDTGTKEGKKILLTRQKLRSGLHDPRGLLNLAGPSTNALDRTKKMELLKGKGYNFNIKSSSFYDKLNAAELRLSLGLGGHSVTDTFLFGAKVLSLPGFLTKKNISDVENNVVTGSTT